MSAKVKLTVYVSEDTLTELHREAERQERSVSWLLQQAWRLAQVELAEYPSPHAPRVVVHCGPAFIGRTARE